MIGDADTEREELKKAFINTLKSLSPDDYIKFHLIPDSKMLDSILEVGKDRFKDDAIKFLENTMGGIEFTEEIGYHAGYMFKFHVSELTKNLKNIFK